MSIWKKIKKFFEPGKTIYYDSNRSKNEPRGGMRNEEQFRKSSEIKDILSGRVRHFASGRLGTILQSYCFGNQLVDDIETGPYVYFYDVRWDDGTVERQISEKDLRNELSTQ
jgi:hypothetical protein